MSKLSFVLCAVVGGATALGLGLLLTLTMGSARAALVVLAGGAVLGLGLYAALARIEIDAIIKERKARAISGREVGR